MQECVCFVDVGDRDFVDVNLGESVDDGFVWMFFATGEGGQLSRGQGALACNVMVEWVGNHRSMTIAIASWCRQIGHCWS